MRYQPEANVRYYYLAGMSATAKEHRENAVNVYYLSYEYQLLNTCF